ncbi:MAG: DNA-binding response regulator, OmpR family, contains and winged-helix domain [Nocardioides sp.]|nr:DNA-binding response regulator, OmpR family, contains and winged-helix domain [Nocardioides sp.]
MRILVVEDDEHVAMAVKRGLQAEGYAVDVGLDGTEGRWLATENEYDLIVLDSMLPGMSGEAICAALRRDQDWTPILMLTARVGTQHEVNALDAGADDFLAKPFAYQELLARIRALLRRSPQERPAVLEVGDLRLDPASHRVWRGEVSIELTPRQFSLLEVLMRQPGEALSKARIREQLWDFAFEGDLNIIEVHVRQLRKRIDEPFGRRSVQTVRGVGYLLDPAGG